MTGCRMDNNKDTLKLVIMTRSWLYLCRRSTIHGVVYDTKFYSYSLRTVRSLRVLQYNVCIFRSTVITVVKFINYLHNHWRFPIFFGKNESCGDDTCFSSHWFVVHILLLLRRTVLYFTITGEYGVRSTYRVRVRTRSTCIRGNTT
jgi:hypothetical protein